MPIIDDVVDILEDGEWHTLRNLARNLELTEGKLRQIIQFLKNLDFIKLDENQEKALISPWLMSLEPLEQSMHT